MPTLRHCVTAWWRLCRMCVACVSHVCLIILARFHRVPHRPGHLPIMAGYDGRTNRHVFPSGPRSPQREDLHPRALPCDRWCERCQHGAGGSGQSVELSETRWKLSVSRDDALMRLRNPVVCILRESTVYTYVCTAVLTAMSQYMTCTCMQAVCRIERVMHGVPA